MVRTGHSRQTIVAFASWVRMFVRFHRQRHPRELQLADVGRFLEWVGKTGRAPLIAIEEARIALEFLYRDVLCRDLGELPRPQPARLLDQVRQVLRVRHYARTTEDCYADWIKRFILFHGKRHPRDLGAAEVQQFLTDLAIRGHVAASTQNQALNALVFLFSQVLGIDLGRFEALRARRHHRFGRPGFGIRISDLFRILMAAYVSAGIA